MEAGFNASDELGPSIAKQDFSTRPVLRFLPVLTVSFLVLMRGFLCDVCRYIGQAELRALVDDQMREDQRFEPCELFEYWSGNVFIEHITYCDTM